MQESNISTLLRVGVSLVFIIGGLSKLSLLLNHETHQAMVDNYMGSSGYINAFFQQYLFDGGVLNPGVFLTGLSTFELISGIMLLIGLMVRPLALLYGFMLWSFVFSLPVMTVPGQSLEVATYQSPAMFVQIRDITLSGFMFIIFALGAGRFSLDARLFNSESNCVKDWANYGLLLRLSIAVTLLVGGSFAGMHKIQSFNTMPWLLLITGLIILFAPVKAQRVAGGVLIAIMIYFIVSKITGSKSVLANLNGFKREFAFLFSGIVLAIYGGGYKFTLLDMIERSRTYLLSSKLIRSAKPVVSST